MKQVNPIAKAKIKCDICKKKFAILIRLGSAYCKDCWENKIKKHA